jgi:hypothetical protein
MALPDTRRLEDLAIEPLSELCKEAYEETAWALENTLKKAVHFGRLLCIAKTKVPHGQWIPWVTETFEDQVSLRNIQRFMQVAESNTTNPSLLEGAKNLDEAMGLIQVKKTSVEVIDLAADVPEVAAELPPQQSSPATTEPEVETSSPKKSSEAVLKWTKSERERQKLVQAGTTVVANMHSDNQLIAWAKSERLDIRVDRKTLFGNPYEMPADGDRDYVCDCFRDFYVDRKPSILNAIPSLRGKVLLCWCFPERCHGETLAEKANDDQRAK